MCRQRRLVGAGTVNQARPPLAVLVGFIAKLPYSGMALYNLHYVVGLQELGYDVHYVERVNGPDECYDPSLNTSGNDLAYGLSYARRVLATVGLDVGHTSIIDFDGRCHGAGWQALGQILARADLVLTVADLTWFDELAACETRLFVDGARSRARARRVPGEPDPWLDVP